MRPWRWTGQGRDRAAETITTSITWQHAAADANCFRAPRRLVARLPNARFVTWPGRGGYLRTATTTRARSDELSPAADRAVQPRIGAPGRHVSAKRQQRSPASAVPRRARETVTTMAALMNVTCGPRVRGHAPGARAAIQYVGDAR